MDMLFTVMQYVLHQEIDQNVKELSIRDLVGGKL